MDEPEDREDRLYRRPPAEGVRIIRAEEAQAALDAGQAAGRGRGDAALVGDAPAQPAGPRPAPRFPLPGSVDPAGAVTRPPVRPDDRWAPTGATRDDLGGPSGEPTALDRPTVRQPTLMADAAGGEPSPIFEPTPRERPPGGGGGTGARVAWDPEGGGELSHWAEPPTGEESQVRRQSREPGQPAEDEMAAWRSPRRSPGALARGVVGPGRRR